jgi:hypothetical protein
VSAVGFGGNNDAGGAVVATVPAGGFAAGSLVALAFGFTCSVGFTVNTATVVDSKNHTWTTATRSSNPSATTDGHIIFWTVLTTALAAGDTITVTPNAGSNALRTLIAGVSFTGGLSQASATAAYTTGAAAGHPTVAVASANGLTQTPTRDGSVVLEAIYITSPARVLTPDPAVTGQVAGTKYLTAATSGNRAEQLLWKEGVAANAATTLGGSFNSGSIFIATTISFSPAPPPSTPLFKEWNGTTWVTLTAKEWNGTAWVTLSPTIM